MKEDKDVILDEIVTILENLRWMRTVELSNEDDQQEYENCVNSAINSVEMAMALVESDNEEHMEVDPI